MPLDYDIAPDYTFYGANPRLSENYSAITFCVNTMALPSVRAMI